MGCDEDDKISLDELIIRAIEAQELSDLSKLIDKTNSKDSSGALDEEFSEEFSKELLNNIISSTEPCPPPNDPIFTAQQLEDLDCLLDESSFLPNQPSSISLDVPPQEISPEDCDEKLEEINEILKIELKEYNDLNILLGRMEEYKDNYRVFTEYFSERAKESARLLNKFQPILEEIRRLEQDILRLEAEIDDLNDDIQYVNDIDAYGPLTEAQQTLVDGYNEQIEIREGEITVDEEEIKENEEIRDTYTSQEDIIKDAGIANVLSGDTTAATANIGHSTSFIAELNIAINASDYSSLKDSIDEYSSTIKVKRVTVGGVNTIIRNPIISFELKFIGLSHMQIEEDLYNEQTGDRTTRDINFPIKSNTRLHENSFFDENQGGVKVVSAPSSPEPTGALYTKYYDKLKDPMALMFTPAEKGLTSSAAGIDPNLLGTGFEKKKEGSTEYYVNDFNKMQNFYENFEGELEIKKQQVRAAEVEPLFSIVAANMKSLARLDIRLLLALGRINLDIIDESSDLQIVFEKIEEDQIAFLSRAAKLDKEMIRVKARMKELKPTPENMKRKLLEISPACFEDKSQEEPPSALKEIADEKEGNDPFGIKTLDGVDPTMPTTNDMQYWLKFTKILNMVNLLPLPKNPTTLRYWPVGFVIPTPAGLIKIPLPIIWIPIIAIPTPMGVLVIFITINGIFISPIVFFMSTSGFKQHKLTIKGSSKQFGFDANSKWVKPTISFPLQAIAAKEAALRAGQGSHDHLTGDEKSEYDIKINALNERLKNANSDSKKKRIQKKIKDLEDSVSNKGNAQLLQENIDKTESVEDGIEDAKKAFEARMDDLGNPEFKNCQDIQNQIEANRKATRKSIDEVYKSDLDRKEKKRQLKELRGKLKKEHFTKDQKKKAIKKDTLNFFDKIKLPTISLPRDKTKINPKETATDAMQLSLDESMTNYNYNMVSSNNKNVRKLMLKNLSEVNETMDFSDMGDKKIKIKGNEEEIKNKLLEINIQVFNKIKGVDDPDLDESTLTQKSNTLQIEIKNETDRNKKRMLKKELKVVNSNISSIAENKITKEDNSIDSSKLSKLSKFKVDFNPFKSLSDMQPVTVNFNTPSDVSAPIGLAKTTMDQYINGLSSEDLSAAFGNREEISPASISDLYFNSVITKVPNDINMPSDLNLKSMGSSFIGVLGSLNMKMEKVDVLAPFSIDKAINLNLNMLLGPIKNFLTDSLDGDFNKCLPVDIENNFNNLNADDIKSSLKNLIFDNIDSFADKLEPAYKLISFLKNATGVTLNAKEKLALFSVPFGPIILAKFVAEVLLKVNLPKSSNVTAIDLDAVKVAKALMKPTLDPIFNIPMSFIIPAAASMVNQGDTMRLLHPILNADDLPPWERLSEKNFLFILFLDEFITEAAEKVGFFRRFL